MILIAQQHDKAIESVAARLQNLLLGCRFACAKHHSRKAAVPGERELLRASVRFEKRYNLDRVVIVPSFTGIIVLATATQLSFPSWVAVIGLSAGGAWICALFSLKCPTCNRLVVSPDREGESPFPLFGRPPGICAQCGAKL